LVKSHTLDNWSPRRSLAKRERGSQELQPSELDRRHDETIGHESHGALKVEWRRQQPRVRNEVVIVDRIPPVEIVNLNSQKIILSWSALLAHCALPDSRQSLSYCVCDATQHLVCGQHCPTSMREYFKQFIMLEEGGLLRRGVVNGRARVVRMMSGGKDGYVQRW
jgi:hypothetical protein